MKIAVLMQVYFYAWFNFLFILLDVLNDCSLNNKQAIYVMISIFFILFSLIDVSEIRLKLSLETAPNQRPHGALGMWGPILSAVGNAFKLQVCYFQFF